MLSIYNCSQLQSPPTFNVYEPSTRLVTNPAPYCAELFNPRCVCVGLACLCLSLFVCMLTSVLTAACVQTHKTLPITSPFLPLPPAHFQPSRPDNPTKP